MVFLLGVLIGVVVGGVLVAFWLMVADMSSVRRGEVLDFTGARPKP